ncbi:MULTISPECIES: mechanosensitive channel protein [Citrobacter freundii complex]|uniref:mechanosensitive channel protein n=1 Tax=Citrobacter freundii complex TaxID=1344959 RepID=UPI000CDC0E95|nr:MULTISPECIES: mechanosensitive channel protein [Citrobacter freundii complex]AUZ68757.1 mechanosensitive channel protein [Citrobacter freundii complex sp. CFNIH4]MBA7949521.1 mechanosensitive channel protein [Citrobacter freundii]POU14347.1 mechanosensitive channel protein [Citrobacter freundii complex sp. CFNIH7]POU18064.1 mechanosensitive channel protein [Citrobacter freundii complex sp. CFNIH6]HCB1466315.1 mechanosensitive channel protein [Citrobacter freundii]
MRGILFIFVCLLSFPTQAVTIPGVTTPTSTNAQTTAAKEPDIEQKKAAYGALADVLENDASRQELIGQLRKVATAPPAEPVPTIVPPTLTEEKTVLENVTDVTRHYGEALSSHFAQLYRNITDAPHKTFNPQTFTNALTHFLMLAVSVFGFFWLVRLCALPLYRKMGQWARRKNRERSNWLQLPAMIVGAFIIDLLLLALTLFVGQILSDKMNAGSRTIAFQQSLFLNAFALIEFFKAILRLIFCPTVAELRPFNIQDAGARYWNRRLSSLSSLIGYGLIVAVPIISNQVNVQVGAMANVIIMLCITLWALYLIFRNKKEITQHLLNLAERSLAFFSLFIRAFALVWHWLASAYFIVLFFFSLFDPGNSLKFMMGATLRSLVIIGIAAFVSGMFSRWIAKTITLSPHTQRSYPELQKRLNGWLSTALSIARILTVCVAVMLLLSAWGLFDFWNWLHYGAGEKTVDILIRIALILFFSAIGWTILASLIENRLASDIHGRPLPSARTRTLLTLFRNALAVIISTITIMIVLSEIGVNIAPLLAGAGALGLAISFGSQTLVKDIITGIFIQFENGMNTGDLVTIGPLTGTVERMSIRSVGVRQDTGAYHIIPWSSITTFANFVRGIGSVVANYDVDRHEDADKANQALKDAVAAVMEKDDIRGLIIGEPSFAGIVGLTNTAFTLRVSFTTLPLKQWTVRFALDSQVKKYFDLANIRAPVQTYQVLPAPGYGPTSAASEPLPPTEPTL